MSDDGDKHVRIFSVETRFQKLARRGGGIPREAAIEKARTKIEEAKPGFEDWLTKEIQLLADLADSAKTGNAPSSWIDLANSYSRQLRDVGTTMDCELITFIASSLCEILDTIAAGAPCNMDSIVCHVDALLVARQRQYRDLKPEQVPKLTSGLRKVVDHVSTSPS
jgi:hypothetical protein